MENFIYLVIRGLSVIYLLYEIFRFLFNPDRQNFWHFLTPKIRVKEKALVPVPETAPYNMVGKSLTVYLEEIPKEKAVEPAFSEDLEKIPAYREEADITNDDVNDDLGELSGQEAIDESERFISLDVEPDNGDYSTGMTYEQISVAMDAVQGKITDNASRLAAARILYEAEGSDLFNFLTAQAENEAIIEKLIKEHIDSNEKLVPESGRKKQRGIEEFDMDKYV